MNRLKNFLLRALWTDPDYVSPQGEVEQMSCPTFVIEPVSSRLYSALLAEASAANAELDGSKVSLHGFEFEFSYNAGAQTLSVTCTKKEIFASCDMVEKRIRDLYLRASQNENL